MTYPIQRRVFLMTLAASAGAAGTLAHAQSLVDEKDGQAAALGYVAMPSAWTPRNIPNLPPGRIAPTARSTKASPATRRRAVRCLQASRSPAPAGAVPGPRRPDRIRSDRELPDRPSATRHFPATKARCRAGPARTAAMP